MLDVGWLQYAKDDLKQIRKDFPKGVPATAKEAFDALDKEIDHATAALVVNEAELALAAGRYRYAGELLAAFPEKMADAKQIETVAKLMARHRTTVERYETGRRLLGNLLDEATGRIRARPGIAVAGGPDCRRLAAQVPIHPARDPCQGWRDGLRRDASGLRASH